MGKPNVDFSQAANDTLAKAEKSFGMPANEIVQTILGVSPERILELVKSDLDGRCEVLPCKIGDKIYKTFCGDIAELEVERIVCWSNGCWKVNAHTEYSRTDWKGFEIDFSDFGKTVFLTREAAEAALKGEMPVFQEGGMK